MRIGRQRQLERMTIHGLNRTPAHVKWCSMLTRCYNPRATNYHNYGGRGIKVCDRWHDFNNFFADMGQPPSSDHSLERIDHNGDYCPENCRWADSIEQARNKRTTRFVTYQDRVMSLAAWVEELGLDYSTVLARLDAGWTVIEAFEAPIRTAQKYEYFGESKTLAEWAEAKDISLGTLKNRIQLYGWSIERALTTEDARQAIVFFRGQNIRLSDWERETGISTTTITKRLKRGWDLERAMTTPPRKTKP